MRSPPPTNRERTSYERHGDLIHDPYLWLEDGTEAVDEWVHRQNEYADEYLGSIEAREELRPRFESYARTTEYGSIVARPTGYFQEVEDADDDQPVLTLRESLEGDREVLLDPNEWSDDATVSIGWWTVSPDGTLLAYGVDEGGDEQYDITILDVAAREPIDELPEVGRAGPPAWTPDGIYYYRTGSADDGAQLEKTVLYHEFGTDPADDTELLTVDDPGTWPAVQTDRAGDHLLLSLSIGWERTELYYAPVGESELSPVLTDTRSVYEPLIHDGRVYLRTNRDAPRYRLLAFDLPCEGGGSGTPSDSFEHDATGHTPEKHEGNALDPDELDQVVPEREAILRGVTVSETHLLAAYENAAVSELEVFSVAGEHIGSVALPGIGTVSGLSGNRDAPEAFFAYQSFDHPPVVLQYDLETGDRTELDRVDVDASIDLAVEQVWYESSDGTEVPMFVVRREGVALEGDNPTLLYGYGGFEVSQTPSFGAFALEFLRSGGVYAQANLRGGGEFGKDWHEAARHERKQHTFDDMIAAAEFLIEAGYTSSDRLAIQGGSNGGLTVGAVLTQRPDLIRAVCCHVPLLDMLRFHTFLLGDSWTTEYGSPDDPAAYEWIKAYSPYHNVEERSYPAILFKTAEGDTRVHPVHAWKMAARMQELTTSDHPILCKTNRNTGHGTGKPTWMVVEEALDVWSFLFSELDVEYADE